MAKMNSFFIRAHVNIGNAAAYAQTEIDIGSYTDLGSSSPELLRIHNMQLSITDSTAEFPSMSGDKGGSLAWQLTTQSQTALVMATDRSVVSKGVAAFRNPDSETIPPTQTVEEMLLPQDFTQGYLAAVPTLYLAGKASNNFTEDVYISVILECTTEKATKANAVSLAVSQM